MKKINHRNLKNKNNWLLERRRRRWLQEVNKKYFMTFEESKLEIRRKKLKQIKNKILKNEQG